MKKAPFAFLTPPAQIMVFGVLAVLSMILFWLLSATYLWLFYGLNIFDGASSYMNPAHPDFIAVNRTLLFFQHLGLFIIPSILITVCVAGYGEDFLQIRQAASPFLFPLALFLVLAAVPLINWTAELNSRISFPAYLRELESWIKANEINAETLTKNLIRFDTMHDCLLSLILVAVLPALGEELFFRGALQKLLLRAIRRRHLTIWITAVLFSGLHFQFYGFVPRMLLGALFGYLMLWSGSLWLPVFAHFTNNALQMGLLYLIHRGTISEDAENFGADVSMHLYVIFSSVIVSAALFIIYKKCKEKPKSQMIN